MERRLLGDVQHGSPEVVHLQSGNGVDDAALLRAGARSVVGVDDSEVAVRAARQGEIVTTLAGAGLAIGHLAEYAEPF